MLNVIVLNVIMLNVVMLNIIMLNVIMQNVIMLNVIMLNVIMLNVIVLNVIMLNVIMLDVIMLNVIMSNVMAPTKHLQENNLVIKQIHYFYNLRKSRFQKVLGIMHLDDIFNFQRISTCVNLNYCLIVWRAVA
jgi:hypothetical protein